MQAPIALLGPQIWLSGGRLHTLARTPHVHACMQAAHARTHPCAHPAGEDVGHYGGSYKVTFDLYKKFGDLRVLDTPICGTRGWGCWWWWNGGCLAWPGGWVVGAGWYNAGSRQGALDGWGQRAASRYSR